MKLLSITAQKPHSTGSGVYLTELVKALQRRRVSQAVVSGIYREDVREFETEIRHYPVWFQEDIPYPIVGMSDEMPYPSTRYKDMDEEMTAQFLQGFRRRIFQAVTEFQPDVILCHHLYFLTSLVREWFPQKRIYGFCHNTDLLQLRQTAFQKERILTQIRKLDGIFALHEEQKKEIAGMFGVETEKIQVVGAGYNSHIFYTEGDGPAGGRPEDGKLRLVFAGKISEKKGVKSLLRSLCYLKEEAYPLEVLLAGGAGSEKEYEEIRKLAEEAPYPVRFLGKLPQEELAEVYRKGDVFVLPSFAEGLPLCVIEALACGSRVVMSEFEGVRQWLDTYVRQGDIRYVKLPAQGEQARPEELARFERDLAKQIRESLNHPQKGRADTGEISWDRIAEKVMEAVASQNSAAEPEGEAASADA